MSLYLPCVSKQLYKIFSPSVLQAGSIVCRAHVCHGRIRSANLSVSVLGHPEYFSQVSFQRGIFNVIRTETRKVRRKFYLNMMEEWNKQKDRLRQSVNYLVLLEC